MAKKRAKSKKPKVSVENNRVPTGIPGFDSLVQGGLNKASVNLVSGGTGCGKTIFGLQYLWEGITKFNEPGVFCSTEEDLTDLKLDAKKFGWDFDELEKQKKCIFIYFNPYESSDIKGHLEQAIKKIGAKRVIIDSISVFGMGLDNEFEVRKALYDLALFLKETGCTTIMTSEIVEEGGAVKLSRFGVEEFLCDSITIIRFESMGGDYSRSLIIRKMRRTKNDEDVHPVEISSKGIVVHSL
jgi:KaiC/GvpD/RAD55 family RecA-like ATPase